MRTRPAEFRFRMELTLLTINTWKCDGDYYNRREVLKNELLMSDAQVILCQECFRSIDGKIDTLGYLSQELGMTAYAVPAREKKRLLGDQWVDSFSGLGILTTLPVTGASVIELPSDEADGGRKAQLVTIEPAPGVELSVANIHLTHLPDDALRRRQLQTILTVMQDSKTAFRIIGGDWNAKPDNPTLLHMMETTPMADCYVLGNGAGQSRWVDHFFTLPLSKPSTYPSFIRAGVVLDQPDAGSGLYPSDHFGIRITLVY
jgi:endonuclease/exonuclease/phosphatase family metal-dependent hydrolase